MAKQKKATGDRNKPNGNSYYSPQYQVIPAYQGPDDTNPTQFIYVLPPTEAKSHGFSSIYGESFAVVIQDVNGPLSTNGSSPPPGGDIALSWTAWPNLTAQIPAYVWNTDPQDRQKLATAFAALLSQLEAMEDNGQLRRGTARYVAQRIVDGLPLQLSEALFYRYGFNASSGYVDLMPGMRLRIEYGSFQSIGPGQPLNSFTGSGVGYYDISTFLKQANGKFVDTIAFSSYLAANRAPSIAPTSGGASSIIDVQSQHGPRRYYRLLYPKTFISPTYMGNPGVAENVTLVGADTWALIQSVTEDYESGRPIFTGADVDAVYFAGRALLIPELLMFVNSVPTWVAIGTTVRNVVERMGHFSFATALGDYDAFLMARQYYQMNEQAPSTDTNYLDIILVPLTDVTEYFGPDVYELPVIAGDSIQITVSTM
jgi:hypothetical protein